LGAGFADDVDVCHVALHRLDHHGVVQGGSADLHPSRATDPRMRDVSISSDLIRGIDDYNAPLHLVGEHAGALPQHRGLADPGAAQEQDALSAYDHVLDDVDRAGDGPADPAGDADDLPRAISYRRDAMQRALDPGAVVV